MAKNTKTYTEETIKCALEKIENGKLSLRAASTLPHTETNCWFTSTERGFDEHAIYTH